MSPAPLSLVTRTASTSPHDHQDAEGHGGEQEEHGGAA